MTGFKGTRNVNGGPKRVVNKTENKPKPLSLGL
jgi:hypothetical protein